LDTRSYLARIASEARHLADESRDFFWSLGTDRGTAGELLARLERFGHDLFERTGVDFRVDRSSGGLDGLELPGDVRRNLASIFKEAMTNALRHAECRSVVLRGRAEGAELVLALEDDGRGFPGTTATSGQGLRNMELRARKAGGTILIASTPGAGTRIALTRSVARPPRA
jgi:signal transduction histidine kinase